MDLGSGKTAQAAVRRRGHCVLPAPPPDERLVGPTVVGLSSPPPARVRGGGGNVERSPTACAPPRCPGALCWSMKRRSKTQRTVCGKVAPLHAHSAQAAPKAACPRPCLRTRRRARCAPLRALAGLRLSSALQTAAVHATPPTGREGEHRQLGVPAESVRGAAATKRRPRPSTWPDRRNGRKSPRQLGARRRARGACGPRCAPLRRKSTNPMTSRQRTLTRATATTKVGGTRAPKSRPRRLHRVRLGARSAAACEMLG